MTPNDMTIRQMTRDELNTLVEWAAREGWNPGLDDAEVFWATDPEGFVAAEIDGELIGGGSIVAYEKKYGFIGLFIVRPEYREWTGNHLWHELIDACWPALTPTQRSAWTACLPCSTTMPVADSVLFVVTFASRDGEGTSATKGNHRGDRSSVREHRCL